MTGRCRIHNNLIICLVCHPLGNLNENEMRIAQLQRKVEIRDATYRKVSEEAEQSKIDHSLETAKITNISVVQPATRDLYAVFPNTRLNLLVALFVAIFVSTGISVLFESKRLRTAANRNGIELVKVVQQNNQEFGKPNDPVTWLDRHRGTA